MENSLKEKAWKDMQSILDKEMPVQKKNRKGWILFFWLGVGILTAWFIVNDGVLKPAAEDQENMKTKAIADKSLITGPNNTTENQTNKTVVTEDFNNGQSKVEDVSKQLNNSALPITKSNQPNIFIESQNPHRARELTKVSEQITAAQTSNSESLLILENERQPHKVPLSEKNASDTHISALSSSQFLNGLTFADIEYRLRQSLADVLNHVIEPVKPVYQTAGVFGIYTGTGLNSYRVSDKNVDIGISYQLKRPNNWNATFSTGLGVHFIDYRAVADLALADSRDFNLPDISSGLNSTSKILLDSKRMLQWQSDISISKLFSQRWFVGIGVEIPYRIFLNEAELEDATNIPGSSSGSIEPLNADSAFRSRLYNRWDVRPVISGGYQFTHNISFQLQYAHGLTGLNKYPLTIADQHYFRQLQGRLHYWF